ncbi:Eukaryotic translation initiation factor 3 subunit [Entamoeba marina]
MQDYIKWARDTVKPFGLYVTSSDSFRDGKAILALLCSLSNDTKTYDKMRLETAKTIRRHVYDVCVEKKLFDEGNARITEEQFTSKELDTEVLQSFIVMIRTIHRNRDRDFVSSVDVDKILKGEVDLSALERDGILGDTVDTVKSYHEKRSDVEKQKERIEKEMKEKEATLQALVEQENSFEAQKKLIQAEEMKKKQAEMDIAEKQRLHKEKMEAMRRELAKLEQVTSQETPERRRLRMELEEVERENENLKKIREETQKELEELKNRMREEEKKQEELSNKRAKLLQDTEELKQKHKRTMKQLDKKLKDWEDTANLIKVSLDDERDKGYKLSDTKSNLVKEANVLDLTLEQKDKQKADLEKNLKLCEKKMTKMKNKHKSAKATTKKTQKELEEEEKRKKHAQQELDREISNKQYEEELLKMTQQELDELEASMKMVIHNQKKLARDTESKRKKVKSLQAEALLKEESHTKMQQEVERVTAEKLAKMQERYDIVKKRKGEMIKVAESKVTDAQSTVDQKRQQLQESEAALKNLEEDREKEKDHIKEAQKRVREEKQAKEN